jgi:hypothetical protein
MRIRFFLLALVLSVVAIAPAASANSYNLFCAGTACGSVQITNISGGVHVNVAMTGGYSIQANANSGGFLFNTGTGLTLSLSNFTSAEFGAVSASLITGVNNGSGKYAYGVVKFGLPNGNTSTTGISFDISGMTTADLLANNLGNVVGVHYCSPGAQTTKCPGPTGFTSSTPGSSVPEPGTLGLLGTGLISLAGIVRRKIAR